ncbi:MAG: hypothetical protein M3Y41_17420 [Pseudomonadota bacterium]|nr:hypothetical protein [Pseudomonadota bacterium]
MNGLRRVQLLLAALAVLPPAAHVLELPNKLALDGALWLAVQQHLYRGWGPAIGAPVEIGALATSIALALIGRGHRAAARWSGLAATGYAGMIDAFFVFNAPVNHALGGWTAASLPSDWPLFRLRWEAGHAIAAILAIFALTAAIRAWLLERHGRDVAAGWRERPRHGQTGR